MADGPTNPQNLPEPPPIRHEGKIRAYDPRRKNLSKWGRVSIPVYDKLPATYTGADLIAVRSGTPPAVTYAYHVWNGTTWVAVPGGGGGGTGGTFHIDYVVDSAYAGASGASTTLATGATVRMYATVQAAINQWVTDNNGDKTIYVYAGTYAENLVIPTGINFDLDIIGESERSVLIGLTTSGNALQLNGTSPTVKVSNVQLRGGATGYSATIGGTLNATMHFSNCIFQQKVGGDFNATFFTNCEFQKGYAVDAASFSPDGVLFTACRFIGSTASAWSAGSLKDHVFDHCEWVGTTTSISVTGADLSNVRFVGCVQGTPGQIFYHQNSASSYAEGLAFIGCFFQYPSANGTIYVQAAQGGVLLAGPTVIGCHFDKAASSTNPFIKCATANAKAWMISGNNFSDQTGGYVEDLGGVSITGVFVDSVFGPNTPADFGVQLDATSAGNHYVGTGKVTGAGAQGGVVQSAFTNVATPTWAATTNNYDPAGATVINVTLTGDQTLTGMVAGILGTRVIIHNIDGLNTLTITNDDVGSSAANRFYLNTAIQLGPDEAGYFRYDPSRDAGTGRWVCDATYLTPGSSTRLQDADNDTFIDVEATADVDKIKIGIPATSSTFAELFKGAESLPRYALNDDGITIGDGATALNSVYLRRPANRVLGLYPASSPVQHAVELFGETGDFSAPASSNYVRLYNKIYGTGTALHAIYSSGQVVGPIGDKALATVSGRGSAGGVDPPLSSTWSDGVWGTLAPAGSWTATGTPSVANDTASKRGRHMNFASGAVSGNDAGIESTLVFWGQQGSAYLFRIRLPDITSIRMFVGVSVGSLATMVGADVPGVNCLGLQFSTPRGDTNWMFHENGPLSPFTIVTNSGVAASTNAIYLQVISGTVNQIALLDADMVPLSSRNAGFGTRPGATTLVRIVAGVETQTAAARDLEIYHIKQHNREA